MLRPYRLPLHFLCYDFISSSSGVEMFILTCFDQDLSPGKPGQRLFPLSGAVHTVENVLEANVSNSTFTSPQGMDLP